MSWFQSLRDMSLSILKDLDRAVDQIAERFDEHVTPAVQDAAGRLDRMIEGSAEDLGNSLRRTAVDVDARYQQFMVRRVDPLFGRTRSKQIEEMVGLEISPQEVTLNRRIAYSAALLVAIAGVGAVFPATLAISVPLSFTMVLPVYERAYQSAKQQGRVTYHVVSAINVTGIWLGGFYVPAIAATLLYYGGEKLLMVTEDRSKKGLIEVFSKQPRTVWLLRDGAEVERPFSEVSRGDVVVVGAGGFMPVDGTVVEGLASIDQHMLTGEAQPVEKAPGDPVYASTVILGGKVHVRVDKAGDETVAAKIGEILNRTASFQLALQSKGTKLAHDAAGPTLLLGGVALLIRGPESGLAILNSTFGVNMRLTSPVAMLNLLNIASSGAILLKDGRSLELLPEVDTVLFDKTGTLTMSQPNVAAIHRAGPFDEERLLVFAAAAEHRQTHPIALAIVAEARARGLTIPEIENARYEVGYGLKVEMEEQRIQVGSERFMRLEGIDVPPEMMARQAESHVQGHSLIMVAVDGRLAGAIELQPTIRPEAEAVIQALRKRGLKAVIISGDQEEPTRRLAERLGIDRYFANVLPEGKASLVAQLQAEGRAVCFVGDGINDSIALKKANVSVSLRGATTAATDAAQVVLMQESLQQLPLLFELGDEMDRTQRMGYAASTIPGYINVAGVFLLGWGFNTAIAINVLSLAVGVGVALAPTFRLKEKVPDLAAPLRAEAGVLVLPPATASA